MQMKLYSFFFLLAFVFVSCKNAEKLYRQGRYDEAVEQAAKKLSKKPGDAATLDILQNAYRFAVSDHEKKIENYTNSNSDLRWENTYREYIGLQNLYEAIRRSPSVYEVVQPTDYSSFVTTYKEEAGNVRYERGLELMDQNTKKGYRDAYNEFQKALSLKPGDLSIKQKLDEAFANAVTNVVILPPSRFGFQYSSYFYDFNSFNYDMLRYLNNNNRSQFLRFYSPNEAVNMRADNVAEMRFSDINIGRYRDQRSTREVSKQIVGKERVIKADSVVKEYITVKAKITTIRRELQADGLLQATIRDIDNRYLWSDTYRSDYRWVYSFAIFTGDERALSDEDKKLINQREQFPPSNDEIIRVIMNDILNKAQCGISDYYNMRY
ncbi:MAG TPA: hypothetical protein VHN59_01920 [Chitinophagaceae bacterium]|nr:hypothetical protein [Chitinophagaceae bacterium]